MLKVHTPENGMPEIPDEYFCQFCDEDARFLIIDDETGAILPLCKSHARNLAGLTPHLPLY